MRFALAPMISGTFVVSMNGRESVIEWAHIFVGVATIYLIIGLLLRSVMYPELRVPGAVALVLGLAEAIPGSPRLHAVISPLLFTALAWGAVARPGKALTGSGRNLRVLALPVLVIIAIFYGVGYRHATSGIGSHIGMAMLAAGVLLCAGMIVNQNHPDDAPLRGIANLTIAAVLFQIVAGGTALVIRMLEINGGLFLGVVRTAHITGAGLVLAAATVLAIQYRLGRSDAVKAVDD